MTNEQIDSLEGRALDTAIAEGMEPDKPAPDRWGPRYSPREWWTATFVSGPRWTPTYSMSTEGGNIAVELMEKMREWGWIVIITDCHDDYMAEAMSAKFHGISVHRISFSDAVARLFLRVCETRKGNQR